uniref:Uncharacterized protein n=1 Tax=Chromera velia CCMP2878 TaxID=1169474 RepID=A0A0G4IES0_9ALVE|eukprot:Cvel_13816.t1-p1 / transcript=Cvel_13816.t1 / gene=Cvel_13816 / organism=Chromera_velia_CCMP2878 / gene_product=DNA replication complex GINS protein PSF2, putative / transcript_product=DNA replication complex GINS protein PSF2, putative / location=Cvel_scaffold959:15343-20296(-) / protein_length=182 / sequence_SO=supercontig / SO=protein_coding / is_pseudo=false
MTYADLEFLGEDTLVKVIPKITIDTTLQLLDQEVGPFMAHDREGVEVPFFVARQMQDLKWVYIQRPEWLNPVQLAAKIAEEREQSARLSELPPKFWELALLYLSEEETGMIQQEKKEIVSLLETLMQLRRDKITSDAKKIDSSFRHIQLTNLSQVEIMELRPQVLGLMNSYSALELHTMEDL